MEKRIETIKSTICTGCSSCFNICPVGAIEMDFDERGFYKPFINQEKCINCGLCDKTCPILNKQKEEIQLKKLYALWAADEIRLSSSSGGAFTLFAQEILKQGGIVFGAAWGTDFKVIHKAIDKLEDLYLLQKSKYLQSYIGDTFKQVKQYLNQNKKVLFVGTPCQIGGLRSYIKTTQTNDSDLYTLDLFCYMVPPYKLFKRYIDDTFGNSLEKFEFRLKDKNHYVSHYIKYKKKNEDPTNVYHFTAWFNAYFSRMYECNACEQCIYQGDMRYGDISLGDFWGIENHDKTWNDGKGTSMVMANTKKGLQLLKQIKPNAKRLEEVPISWIRDGQSNGKQANPNQPLFYDLLNAGVYFNKAANMALAGKTFDIGLACVQVYKNYGSAFTNYAMYKLLKDYGKEVLLITQPMSSEIKPNQPTNYEHYPFAYGDTAKYFANKHDMQSLNKICKKFLVGSDQLFNYEIYKRIDGFVKLDWVDDLHDKVCYSTSFGVNSILGPKEEQADFKKCIQRFKHVSVREQSAVDLVKQHFNISSTCVLDPVFLCNKNHYIDLFKNVESQSTKNKVFCYILDPERDKQKSITNICEMLNKDHFIVADMWRTQENIESLWDLKTNLKVKNELWMANIYNSDFVATDSFHGLCFAILFNKPFIVFHNKLRGNARFESILKLIHLEDRLIPANADKDTIQKLINTPIDWKNVNEILNNEIEYSKNWFENNIIK